MNLKIGFEEITMFQSPLLLLCNGPVHVARLGDDFVAKIADQSSQVFGQIVHGDVLDVIVIVVIVIVAPPPLIVVGFQLFMPLGRPRSLQVVLECVHEVTCYTSGGKKTDHSLCVSQKATFNVLKDFYGRFELVKDEAGSAAGVLHHLLQLLFELQVLLDKLLALQIHNKELLRINLIGRLLDQWRLTISSLGHLEKAQTVKHKKGRKYKG